MRKWAFRNYSLSYYINPKSIFTLLVWKFMLTLFYIQSDIGYINISHLSINVHIRSHWYLRKCRYLWLNYFTHPIRNSLII